MGLGVVPVYLDAGDIHLQPDGAVSPPESPDPGHGPVPVAAVGLVLGIQGVGEGIEVPRHHRPGGPFHQGLDGLLVGHDPTFHEHGEATQEDEGAEPEGGARSDHGGVGPPAMPWAGYARRHDVYRSWAGRIPSMSEESQNFCELGEEHLRREEPEEALQWYERAIREDPQDPEAWSGRARACYHLGQLERADRYFRRAQRYLELTLGDRPRDRGWWSDDAGRSFLRLLHWRALCRFWMGLYDDSARLFKRILKRAPHDPLEVRFLLGETYFRMGDLDRAAVEFERAGDDPDACYNLGLTWLYRGDFVRSVNAFRRGIFENLYLVASLAGVEMPAVVPSWRGTHPKELDSEDAAMEYTDRCGDLWTGRILLQRWLKGIYEHPVVQEDLRCHLEQIATLSRGELRPGEVARLEGRNTTLRNPRRLARTDATVAATVMRKVFRLPDPS